jgi:hypothetical protein
LHQFAKLGALITSKGSNPFRTAKLFVCFVCD